MTLFDRVDYDVTDGIAVLAMHHAPVNALDSPMLEALHTGLRQADADDAVRVILLTSALPGMYCGGMDLKMVARGDGIALRDFVQRLYMDTLDIQHKLRKPTIAVINGPARGAGMTLSITCDMIVAADDVDLGYPELDIGLVPAIHFVHLPRQLSRHQAFELLFTGRPIPATRAADLGLINYAVPRAELMPRARALATVLAEKSPTLMALARAAFHRANDLDYRRNVDAQIAVLCNAFETADGREGLAAFAEKRAPVWTGRVPPRR